MKKLLATALGTLLLTGCITNPRGPGLTASLYTWDDRENPIAATTTSNLAGFGDYFYGSALFSNLLTLQPDLDTRTAVPYLLEICEQDVCHYSVLFPSFFTYNNNNVGGFATINELTSAFYHEVRNRPKGEVRYYLDQYAVQVLDGEVPGYVDGSIGYEDIALFDYHRNPEQLDLMKDSLLITLVSTIINEGNEANIGAIMASSAIWGGGGGGGGGGGTGRDPGDDSGGDSGGDPASDSGGVTPTSFTETTTENTALSGTLPSNDPDGLPTTGAFAVGTSPINGALSLNSNSGAYTYTPNADFSGSDGFTATVTDVGGYATTVTVTVAITPVDDGSSGGGGSSSDTGGVTPTTLAETTAEDTAQNGMLPTNDPDGLGAGAFALGSGPSHGLVSLNAGTGAYTYTPATDFNGTDSFSVTVTDIGGYSTTVTVNVTVTPVDDGGVAPTTLTATIAENTALNGTLPANDPDGLPSTGAFAVGTDPSNGTLSLNSDTGAYTYAPATGFSGSDSFTAVATDVDGDSTTVAVNVTVSPAAGSGGSGGSSGAHCIVGTYPGGDIISVGSGTAEVGFYCPDGAIYLSGDCLSDGTCGGFPVAERACTLGQSSAGCVALSAGSTTVYTCPDGRAYEANECSASGDGTYNCIVNE